VSEIVDSVPSLLREALAAEKAVQALFSGFSEQGDDAEVQSAFRTYAADAVRHVSRVAGRLEELHEIAHPKSSVLERVSTIVPELTQMDHLPEEKLLQNLLSAFAVCNGQRALYELLACRARAENDSDTEDLAREIQLQKSRMGEMVWHWIPTRAKIAFNLLTADEVDPSIETRAADNRLT
jgi:rubrerythrin